MPTGVLGDLNMLVECHKCQAKVDAKEMGKCIDGNPTVPPDTTLYVLGKCPVCKSVILSSSYWSGFDGENEIWADGVREWPYPELSGDTKLPKIVAVSLHEARKCFNAGCYLAATVMCGRALEGICVAHKTETYNLSRSLDELLRREIIDKKLHKWGHATRTLRNLAAHATEEEISKDDAQDLLEFTKATCDYVFVLTERFEAFMKRNSKRKKPLHSRKPTLSAPPKQASEAKKTEPAVTGAAAK